MLETDGLPLLDAAWYMCATAEHCTTDWDRHRIAHIENMTDVSVDYPDKFDLSLNATLSITEILPDDDRKVFICRGKVQYVGIKEHATLIEIATGMIL